MQTREPVLSMGRGVLPAFCCYRSPCRDADDDGKNGSRQLRRKTQKKPRRRRRNKDMQGSLGTEVLEGGARDSKDTTSSPGCCNIRRPLVQGKLDLMQNIEATA